MTARVEGIGLQITGIGHAALRCTDPARARVFYIDRLGFPLVRDGAEGFVFAAGGSTVAVRGPREGCVHGGAVAPGLVGLDHLALGCTDAGELRRAADVLTAGGIRHSGVRVDAARGRQYLEFADPDGIEWQLYVI